MNAKFKQSLNLVAAWIATVAVTTSMLGCQVTITVEVATEEIFRMTFSALIQVRHNRNSM